MAMVINTNVMSLNAQRNLTLSQNDMSTAMERLSSGKRINTAGDDAAGLAISNRLTSQVRGLNQAIRNANDGISMIQTAEGALDETTNILQRMRELAIQSANGIYSDANRSTLQAEVEQLILEMDRISATTTFNGLNILDGTLGQIDLQAGATAYETISFNIGSTSSSELGLGATTSDLSGDRITTGGTADVAQGAVLINGTSLDQITNLGNGGATDTTLQDVVNDINTNVDGVTATAFNVVQAETVGTGALTSTETLRITLGSVDGGASVTYDISDTDDMAELVDKINSVTGGTVAAAVDDSGRLQLSNTTGGTITVAYDDANPFAGAQAGASLETITGIDDTGADGTESFAGQIALSSDDGSPILITTGAGGTDADLAVLGFGQVVGQGQFLSDDLDSTAQNAAIASGDVLINGVDIGVVDANDGLGAKVDAINAVADESGVTASIEASDAFAFNADISVTELTVTASALGDGETLTFNGITLTFADGDNLDDIADVINTANQTATTNTGVTAYVDGDGDLHLYSEGPMVITDGTGGAADLTGAGVTSGQSTTPAAPSTGSIRINNNLIAFTDLTDIDQVVTEVNAQSAVTGVTASVDENGEFRLEGTSAITIALGDANALTTAVTLGLDTNAIATDGLFNDADTDGRLNDETIVINPRIKLDTADDATLTVEVTADGAAATGLRDLNTDLSALVTGQAISGINIGTADGAQRAISALDNALEQINDIRSELGAINNRLDFTINNLSSVSENAAASRSRIMDADFAAESAALSRAQVLQQAGTAMLAQANAAPQQVLSLLQ